MRHLVSIFTVFLCSLAFSTLIRAQYIEKPDSLINKGGKIVTTAGEKLSSDYLSKIVEPNLYTDYKSAKRKFNAGMTMTCIGGSLLVYGSTWMIVGEIMYENNAGPDGTISGDMEASGVRIVGASFFIPSIVLSAVGIPTLVKGKKGLKRVVARYNEASHSSDIALSLGATHNGFGLKYSF